MGVAYMTGLFSENIMADRDETSVGLIGTGNMGSAFGESLLAANFHITVWNRTICKQRVIDELP
jgi:phosphoglycerate dehydrogenase-like enzyme